MRGKGEPKTGVSLQDRPDRCAAWQSRPGQESAVRTTTQTSRGSPSGDPGKKAGQGGTRPRANQEKQDQAGGRGGGPARVTTPQGGGKAQSPRAGDGGSLQACCQTGWRTGAGTRAIRSHLPRSASLYQRQPAAPPSTRLTHMMQRKMVIRIQGSLVVPRSSGWRWSPQRFRSHATVFPAKRRTSFTI